MREEISFLSGPGDVRNSGIRYVARTSSSFLESGWNAVSLRIKQVNPRKDGIMQNAILDGDGKSYGKVRRRGGEIETEKESRGRNEFSIRPSVSAEAKFSA